MQAGLGMVCMVYLVLQRTAAREVSGCGLLESCVSAAGMVELKLSGG